MTKAEQRVKLVELMCRAVCLHCNINPDCQNPFEFYWQSEIPSMTAILDALHGHYTVNSLDLTPKPGGAVETFQILAESGDLTKPKG